jgi:hypothetical protein
MTRSYLKQPDVMTENLSCYAINFWYSYQQGSEYFVIFVLKGEN